MAKNWVWNLKKESREMKKWVEKPDNLSFMRDGQRERLEKELSRPTKVHFASLKNSLDQLAIWEGTFGAVKVLDGDAEGWENLHASWRFLAWSVRINYAVDERMDDPDRKAPSPSGRVALCLAQAIALGEDSFADWCGGRILAILRSRPGAFHGWEEFPFGPFMTKLHAIRKGLPPGQLRMGSRPIGVYQAVIDSWEDPDALGPALTSICQYHCDKAYDDPDGFPEFEWYPYNVDPVEIQAIRRIRQEQGHFTPEVDHPLLDSPMARPPAVAPPAPADELLDRVIVHLREVLPSIGDPW